MAIKTLADPTIAYEIAKANGWAECYITVYGPGTLFIGPNKEQLEMPEGGTLQGTQLTSNNTSGATSPPRIRFFRVMYGRGSIAKMQIDASTWDETLQFGRSRTHQV